MKTVKVTGGVVPQQALDAGAASRILVPGDPAAQLQSPSSRIVVADGVGAGRMPGLDARAETQGPAGGGLISQIQAVK